MWTKLRVIFVAYLIMGLVIAHIPFSLWGVVLEVALLMALIVGGDWLVQNWVFKRNDDGHR